ncbi:MAG TPA: bacteriohemerythrin [Anaeromyxobacter sp.]|nr:bacteriohemerythrin [Anaeromyxobacter sp.]
MPTWTQAIAVGHPTIDEQHRELFARADELLEAMKSGRAGEELLNLLAFLKQYVAEHFGTEERLMDDHRYPSAAAHKALHTEFVRRLKENEEAYSTRGSRAMVILDLRDMVRGWLVNHVSTVDLQLANFLRREREPRGGASPLQNSARPMIRPPK